jgi:two-component system phosphate regulon response regulator PhoB
MSSSSSLRRPFSGVRPRGPLVLLAEEEDTLRELHAAELAAAGFMVLEAADGATAIEKALQLGPHALVLDLVLPGVDGLKVARRLRGDDRTHDIAILAMTEPGDDKLEAVAIAAGCDSVLSKPIVATSLIAELLRQMAKRAQSAPESGRAGSGP